MIPLRVVLIVDHLLSSAVQDEITARIPNIEVYHAVTDTEIDSALLNELHQPLRLLFFGTNSDAAFRYKGTYLTDLSDI